MTKIERSGIIKAVKENSIWFKGNLSYSQFSDGKEKMNTILTKMQELKNLRIELSEFTDAAREAIASIEAQWYSLEKLYNIYKKFWRKLILWDRCREKDYQGDEFLVYDWGYTTRGLNEEVNRISYLLKENPINFENYKWDEKAITEAFSNIMSAYINREELKKVLEKPMEDIKVFEDKLKQAVKNKEDEIVKEYDEKIFNSERVKGNSLLNKFFRDKDVKDVILRDLLEI